MPRLRDSCDFPWVKLVVAGNVAGEVDNEISPAYCTLVIIFCDVTKISCGLLAAFILVFIVTKIEKNPSASLRVKSSMSMVFRG